MNIYFSHGKESGPWGSKIKHLAAIAEELGYHVESIDYREILDPELRVNKLVDIVGTRQALLVGSSMGAYVSTVASGRLDVAGMFLMAPAFYLPGYRVDRPQGPASPVTIVHGWRDEIVPVDNAIRFAREFNSALHVIDSDHGLNDSLDTVGDIFAGFLARLS
jgi:pimeloyl-ACP methyl ester carboxylesterase